MHTDDLLLATSEGELASMCAALREACARFVFGVRADELELRSSANFLDDVGPVITHQYAKHPCAEVFLLLV